MKTRCPDCQTTFRVSPEQLKARAGKVRCGQCQAVFNALDHLLEESDALETAPRTEAVITAASAPDAEYADAAHPAAPAPDLGTEAPTGDAPAPDAASPEVSTAQPLSASATHELGKAAGLILPRETTEIPGYSKWAEGMMTSPLTTPAATAVRWPFVIAAVILALILAGQILFRFHSELVITTPILRPFLETLSQAFGAEIPLPRHSELVSIETSDLQSDPGQGKLLILNATLRNRASYGQAFPSLELSLTDTQDAAIARRVFAPNEYLSPKMAGLQTFAANSDIAVRLWIDAKDISASGYRLYVFYP